MSTRKTHSQDQPSTARRALLTGGAVGLAAVAGATLGGAAPASAATNPSITDWINVVTDVSPGADPTGTNDSAAAINNAIAALPPSGGVIYIPTGKFKIASATIAAVLDSTSTGPIYIRGAGKDVTILEYYGTGDCIRMYNSEPPGTGWVIPATTLAGGGISDLTIDGYNAAQNTNGIHIGDSNGYELRGLRIQNFLKGGCIGLYFDDTVASTEKTRVDADIWDNHTGVVFDVNSGGDTGNGTGSFMYSDFTFYMHVPAGISSGTTNGIIIRNGAFIRNSSLRVRGNWQLVDGTVAAGACLKIIGSGPQNSNLERCFLDIAVETDQTGSVVPQTIYFDSAINIIQDCTGQLVFSVDWTPSNIQSSSQISFGGVIFGDANLIGKNTTPPSGWL